MQLCISNRYSLPVLFTHQNIVNSVYVQSYQCTQGCKLTHFLLYCRCDLYTVRVLRSTVGNVTAILIGWSGSVLTFSSVFSYVGYRHLLSVSVDLVQITSGQASRRSHGTCKEKWKGNIYYLNVYFVLNDISCNLRKKNYIPFV